MLELISPRRASEMAAKGEARLVDIRESVEYAERSIPGSRLVPLSVADVCPMKDADAPDKPIIYFCQSGNRTQKNAGLLAARAGGMEAYQIEGGLNAWQKEGLPVERHSSVMPMSRQILLGAGIMVLLGTLGSIVWPPLVWFAAFVGAGLTFAGATGFCGLGLLLARMPWNRR